MLERDLQLLSVSETGATLTNTPSRCPAGLTDRSRTCLVEIINYPLLYSASRRSEVLSRREYDAILLVYDVRSRASFEHVKTLHAEISRTSLASRDRRRRKTPSAPTRRSGGAAGGTSSQQGSKKKKKKKKVNRSLWDLFIGSSPWGKDRDREGQPAAGPSRVGAEATVVAVVGNKCDLQDGEDTPAPSAGGCECDDDGDETADDLDHALALFGYPSSRGPVPREHLLAPPTSNGAALPGQDIAITVRPCHDTDGVDEPIQTERAEESNTAITADEVSTDSTPAGPQTATQGRTRQVSIAEGEALALELSTNVSFFEASAKTGENVQELFDATVRAVLTERRRGLSSEDDMAKIYRQSCRLGAGATGPGSDAGCTAPGGGVPRPGLTAPLELDDDAGSIDSVWPVRGSPLDDGKTSVVVEKTVGDLCEVGEQQRRNGLMQRVRGLFGRKQPAPARDVAFGHR